MFCQSFADLWVDFLLKETEEREKREAAEASKGQQKGEGGASPFSNQSENGSSFPSRGRFQVAEHSDSEFSTVPLTSSETNYQFSRPPRY